MSQYDFDLFVIGAGSGGVRASRMAAGFGARVAVAEDRYLGGTCVNVGCVPKKLFSYAAHFAEDIADAAGYGWDVAAPGFDWPRLVANKNAEISRLNGIYRNLLLSAGVQLIEGRARFIDSHHVEVDGRRYSAERVLIATGGWPHVPDFPGNEHVISSNEVFFLDKLPKRVLVVGGAILPSSLPAFSMVLVAKLPSSIAGSCSCADLIAACGSTWPLCSPRRESGCGSTVTSPALSVMLISH